MEIVASLQPFLQEAWKKAGFKQLTAIQEKAIPLIHEGKDIIAESATGTGKTLAYVIPLLERIQPENKNAQAVILAPTRELVMQIAQVIQTFTHGTEISSASFIGGADMKRQIERLKKHPQIIVGTPGRIKELIQAKKLKMHEVKSIVVDEADQILQQNLLGTIQDIIKTTLKSRQLLFFSATIPQKVEELGKEWMKELQVIRISQKDLPRSQVDHIYFVCDRRDKVEELRKIVKMDQGKYMAFVSDSINLEELSQKLGYKGIRVGVLQGSAWKTERETVLRNFREGKLQLLLTTDLAARGLDIQEVTHVIHYDLPDDLESYIHRSGRTGRMGREGTVISIITDREVGKIHKLSKSLGVPIIKKELYGGGIIDPKPVPQERRKKNIASTSRKGS